MTLEFPSAPVTASVADLSIVALSSSERSRTSPVFAGAAIFSVPENFDFAATISPVAASITTLLTLLTTPSSAISTAIYVFVSVFLIVTGFDCAATFADVPLLLVETAK